MFAKPYSLATMPFMQRYLTGMAYPAKKEEILRFVDARHVPTTLIDSIKEIPTGTYLCTMDVLQEIEECERGSAEAGHR
jgi:hypothetical protein